MPSRQQCRDLAERYFDDARVLYRAARYDGAAYLCGYALELALKARICRHLKLAEYPPVTQRRELQNAFKSHDFQELKLLGGLGDWPKIEDVRLQANWQMVARWKPEWRYQHSQVSRVDCAAIIRALSDSRAGILTWLKKNW